MESALFNIENGVATITLNRPDKFNAVIQEMALSVQEFLKSCFVNDEVRCILLTGTGKAFCAGQDLKEAVDDNGIDLPSIVAKHYNPIIQHIRNIEKPVVCAVNGVAAGAGANIALACDIVVATESASFIQAFSKIGLIPDSGGTFILPRLIGVQKATALMMLGDKVSAKEADRMGMIYRAIPDDQFESEVAALVNKLAKMPTVGLGLTKRALNKSLTNDLDTQLNIEEQLQSTASMTNDYEEGVAAFLEKRKPTFTGS